VDILVLLALQPDWLRLAQLERRVGVTGVTVFAQQHGECALQVRSFVPSSGINEDPVCGSGNASVALFLRDRLAALEPGRHYRFIDFAPSLALSHWLRTFKNIEYRTADYFRPNVDDQVDISNMPLYGDNSVDLFMCSHILEHVPDDRAAMRELFLAAGGVAGVTAFISLWALMRWFKSHEAKGFDPFAYYCMAFGAIATVINIVAP
jgi:hypothetical protein